MSKQGFRILLLSSWYPSRVHRTLGNFVERHAKAIAQQHEVTVLYITSDPVAELSSHEFSEEFGMKVLRVYFRPGSFRPRDHYKAFNYGLKLLAEKGNNEFDLVHGNVLYPSAMQALQLSRTRGLPFLYTEHWTGYHRSEGLGIGLAGKLMIRHAAKKAHYLCPVSEHLASSMRSHGLNGNYEVIPNVVDTELFQAGKKTERFRFLHISSLVDEHKNISGMLRAIARVLEKKQDLEFHLIGDGDPKPHLKYARDLNIPEENLSISGEISLREVARKMAESHAFLMFSHYENLPCVILEAFSCGIPVISSDTGGIREHLDPSRGILVTNGMEDELERAILQVHRGYDDFNPDEIRDYAVKNFSEEAIAHQYTQLYGQMLSQ